MELYVRRRLFELVEAKLSYKYELVDIFDVYSDIFEESEGEQSVSKLGITLLRDNRDSFLFTRTGNRTSIDSELAGLGGMWIILKLICALPNLSPQLIYETECFNYRSFRNNCSFK